MKRGSANVLTGTVAEWRWVMRRVSCLLAVLLVWTGCSGSQSVPRNPIAPSVVTLPTLSGVSPDAIPIGLGETVTRVVTPSDPPYETRWGPEPCLRFSVQISTSGALRVRLTHATGLTLWVGSTPSWDVNEITSASPVQAGGTYEIAVSLHDSQTSQAFELTTSLEAF
jgi:hypothetical protein